MFGKRKWKKEAKLTIKGSNKFIHYKRDLIDEEQIKNIRARQEDVKEAIKSKDSEEVKEKCSLLEEACKSSLRGYTRPSWLAENTEVFFVAIVVALGLRAYYLQPFRIPTGSMQPTLNGINGHVLAKDKWPSLPVRLAQYATHGRSYVDLVADRDMMILDITEYQSAKFFTRCKIEICDVEEESGKESKKKNKRTITVSGSRNALMNIMQGEKNVFKKGEVIAQGFIDTGDLVLVDKVSYHFRKPKRGETFVFDTRNINEIHDNARDGQPEGSHYIKRCVGIPGDTLSLDNDGNLIVNGKIAQEKGIQYAMQLDTNKSSKRGYDLASKEDKSQYSNPLDGPDKSLNLADESHRQKAEYAAFGDNTGSSSDSRYWGPVRQYNLIGPAFISLWPFSHEIDPHWGIVK